jgi:DivIVA domain-containing protein
MGAVELDRQVIERRDFPIVRRGYDPASVDAHLRALAADVEELRREASSRGQDSLAAVAAMQVQGILEAAQATAETIEREAAQAAQDVREAADADARRTREEAIARAQERVTAVSQATEALLARVGTMDSETQTLVESLRSGASRLAGDLAEVESNMSALYDAAAGRAGGTGGGEAALALVAGDQSVDDGPVAPPPGEPHERSLAEPLSDSPEGVQGDPYAGAVDREAAHEEAVQAATRESHEALQVEAPADHSGARLGEVAHSQEAFRSSTGPTEPAPASSEDLDGARLVALNMALNGDSREETGLYLAKNFNVPDRERLLDEVYAAIEG